MNHRETKRVLELFTGVSGCFFSGLRPGPRRRDPGAGTPAGQVAGSWVAGLRASTQAHAAHLADGGSFFFPLDDLSRWLIILTQTQDFNVWFFFLMTHQ